MLVEQCDKEVRMLRRTPDEEPEATILPQSIEAGVRLVGTLANSSPKVSCQSHKDEEGEDLEC